jgi:hypothetical protein
MRLASKSESRDKEKITPIEYKLLEGVPIPLQTCPKCGQDFYPFLRGQVQRSKRFLWLGRRRPYCTLICYECKKIVGWESP